MSVSTKHVQLHVLYSGYLWDYHNSLHMCLYMRECHLGDYHTNMIHYTCFCIIMRECHVTVM